MLKLFLRAAGQLGDPAFQKILWRGVLGALLILLFAFVAAQWSLATMVSGEIGPWIEAALIAALLLLFYFFFTALATALMAVFLDDIVDAVEARHYPLNRATRRLGWGEGILLGLRMSLMVLWWNLLALPLYLVLLFTVLGPFVLFLALNGYLLGREYLDMVAARHLPPSEALDWRRAHRADMLALGIGTTLIFMVPVLNLLAPLLGAAAAVHLFHQHGARI